MFDKLREKLAGIKFSRRKNVKHDDKENKSDNDASGGKIYAVWLVILPLLMGLVLGRLADAGLGYALDKFSGTNGMADSAVTGSANTSQESSAARGLDEFLAVNPFHISPQKQASVPPAPECRVTIADSSSYSPDKRVFIRMFSKVVLNSSKAS